MLVVNFSIFKSISNFFRERKLMNQISDAESREALNSAIAEAMSHPLSAEQIETAKSKGRNSALEKMSNSSTIEEYQKFFRLATVFQSSEKEIQEAKQEAIDKALKKIEKTEYAEYYTSAKKFVTELGVDEKQLHSAEEMCRKNVLSKIINVGDDSTLKELLKLSKDILVDENLLNDAKKQCKENAYKRLEKANFVSDVEKIASIADLCGASYQETLKAKHSTHCIIIYRIQQSTSLSEAQRLALVAGALGLEPLLIDTAVKMVQERIAKQNT